MGITTVVGFLIAVLILLSSPVVSAADVGLLFRNDCSSISGPVAGQVLCFDRNNNEFKRYNGTSWVSQKLTSPEISGTVSGGATYSSITLATPIFSGVSTIGGNRFFHNTGTDNTFFGSLAGTTSLSGATNVGIGSSALSTLTSGDSNTFIGGYAAVNLTSGYSNVGVGNDVMNLATTGFRNTCIGSRACANGIITGDNNTAVGRVAMIGLTSGVNNVGIGANSLYQLTIGTGNTAVGVDSGGGSSGGAITTGVNNTFLGYGAKPTGNVNRSTAIGYNAQVSADDKMVLGDPTNASLLVGIGTMSPISGRLHIEGTNTINSSIYTKNTTAGGNVLIHFANPSAQWEVGLRGDSSDAFVIDGPSGRSLSISTSGTTTIDGNATIDSLGNGSTVFMDKFSTTDLCATTTGAIDQIGSTVTTLIIDRAVTCGASKTFPSTLTIKRIGQGTITVATGVILTYNSKLEAGRHTVFIRSGTAVVTFVNNFVIGEYFPEWFGAVPGDSTDDYTAIQGMLTYMPRGAKLSFANGVYDVLDTPTMSKPLTVEGAGCSVGGGGNEPWGTIIKQNGGVTKDAWYLDGTSAELDGWALRHLCLGGTANSRYALRQSADVNRGEIQDIGFLGAGTAFWWQENGNNILNDYRRITGNSFAFSFGYAKPTTGLRVSSGSTNVFSSINITGLDTVGAKCLDLTQGPAGNWFFGLDIEGCHTAIDFGSGAAADNWFIGAHQEQNTTVVAGSSINPKNASFGISGLGGIDLPSTVGANWHVNRGDIGTKGAWWTNSQMRANGGCTNPSNLWGQLTACTISTESESSAGEDAALNVYNTANINAAFLSTMCATGTTPDACIRFSASSQEGEIQIRKWSTGGGGQLTLNPRGGNVRLATSGITLFGNAAATGASSGEAVLANGKALNGVTDAGGSVIPLIKVAGIPDKVVLGNNTTTVTTASIGSGSVVYLDKFSTTDLCAATTGAIDQIGSTVTTLIIDRAVTCGTTKTSPSTLHFNLIGDASLTISGGVTLTVNGPVSAWRSKGNTILGSGSLVFGSTAYFSDYISEAFVKINHASVTNLSGTAFTTGGSLATGTYYYKVYPLYGTLVGDPSDEISVSVTGPNGRVDLSWTAPSGSSTTIYRVARGTSSGSQAGYYDVTGTAYSDTGASFTSSGNAFTQANSEWARFGGNIVLPGFSGRLYWKNYSDGAIAAHLGTTSAGEMEYRPPSAGGARGVHVFGDNNGTQLLKIGRETLGDSVSDVEVSGWTTGNNLKSIRLTVGNNLRIAPNNVDKVKFGITQHEILSGVPIAFFNSADDGTSMITNPGGSGRRDFRIQVGSPAKNFDFDQGGGLIIPEHIYYGSLATGVVLGSGAGSPEGVVSAPVGSLWLRNNGANGTTLYSKESGTGNTGWSSIITENKLTSPPNIGTTTPASGSFTALTTSGKRTVAVTTVTSSSTLSDSNEIVLCDASSEAVTITLQAISGQVGRRLSIKKIDSSTNACTIDGNASETIDGSTTKILTDQYEAINLIGRSTEWSTIASSIAQSDQITSLDHNETTTTLAQVTGLSKSVSSGITYQIRGVFHTTITSGGQAWDLSGTATITNLVVQLLCVNSSTGATTLSGRFTALNTELNETAAGAHEGFCTMNGSVTVNAGGTLFPRFAQQGTASGTAKVLRGSIWSVK